VELDRVAEADADVLLPGETDSKPALSVVKPAQES
jgi:hypothetical protein